MKKLIVLCLTLLLILPLASCEPERILVGGHEDEEELKVDSAANFFIYLERYFNLVENNDYLPADNYLLDKDFSIAVTFTEHNANTALEGDFYQEDADWLPYEWMFIRNSGKIYSKQYSTCYGSVNLPVETYFKQTQTHEHYVDIDALTSYLLVNQETKNFMTYPDFEEPQTETISSYKYPYTDAKEFDNAVNGFVSYQAESILYTVAFREMFGEIENQETLAETLMQLTITGEYFQEQNQVVNFAFTLSDGKAICSYNGRLDLATYELTVQGDGHYLGNTEGNTSRKFTLTLKTQNLDDISFEPSVITEVSSNGQLY